MAEVEARGPFHRFLADYGLVVVAGVALAGAALAVGLFLFGDRELVRSLLDRYGMAALFAVLILEGAMLLYFAPSEALVPAGIALLAESGTEVAVVILVAVAGATAGQFLLFTFAKRGGREYLLEKPWFRVGEDRLDRFDRWFDRWGPLVVPVSNALLFTRGMLTVPAGLAEMDDGQFLVLSALGSLAFQTWLALVALGLLGRL
ncbi:MAG: VTT domain-containing protein [Haloarculaceae archaeon]